MRKDQDMEVLGRTTLLEYVNDIVIIENSKREVEKSIRKLIVKSKYMGLKIKRLNLE
jgi:hypothetical protein